MGLKTIVQVSGDTDKPNGFSTLGELQLSIEVVRDKSWIRLTPDSTGRADHYHFRGPEARILASMLIELAAELERRETLKGNK